MRGGGGGGVAREEGNNGRLRKTNYLLDLSFVTLTWTHQSPGVRAGGSKKYVLTHKHTYTFIMWDMQNRVINTYVVCAVEIIYEPIEKTYDI